jgi:hypothetical protein
MFCSRLHATAWLIKLYNGISPELIEELKEGGIKS